MIGADPQQPIRFDDFLGLKEEEFQGTRLIVLTGMSGSGKSTALKFLADQHPAFREQPWEWIWALGKKWNPRPIRKKRLVVVDEVVSVRQLPGVLRLLQQNRTVAVASHLPQACFWPFQLFFQTRHFRTDKDMSKISRELARQGIPSTPHAVSEFCRQYGANYVDLECILERHPGRDFGHALQLSRKLDRLGIEKSSTLTPVMPVLLDS